MCSLQIRMKQSHNDSAVRCDHILRQGSLPAVLWVCAINDSPCCYEEAILRMTNAAHLFVCENRSVLKFIKTIFNV